MKLEYDGLTHLLLSVVSKYHSLVVREPLAGATHLIVAGASNVLYMQCSIHLTLDDGRMDLSSWYDMLCEGIS